MTYSREMTRRQFLRSAVTGAAGLAAWRLVSFGAAQAGGAAEQTAEQIAPSPAAFDLQTNTVRLRNGVDMPILGLGTAELSEEQTEQSVYWALQAGHRLIDTAAAYRNEAAVGRGVRRALEEGVLRREELFLTTKLWPTGVRYTMESIDAALQSLNVAYIDLLLMHQPQGEYLAGYQVMEEAVRQGKVRSIGVSNFSAGQMESLLAVAEIPPAVQQVETHLHHQQHVMRSYLEHYGIALETWFPLGGRMNREAFLTLPEVQQIAAVHGRTPAQVIIRWHLQSGHVCIPGSGNEAHIRENRGALDFALTEEDMIRLNALNKSAPYYKRMGGKEAETLQIMADWQSAE